MIRNKKILIIALVLLIIAIIGTTLAWVSWNSSTNTDVSVDIDDCTVVQYNGGENITSSSLIPTLTKEEGIIKELTISQQNTCDVSSSVNIYLQINTMGTGLNYEYFKWEFYKNGSSIATGNFKGKATGNTITLTTNQAVTTTQDTYTLYLWIDGNVDNPASIDNQAFDFSIYATGSGRLESSSSGGGVQTLLDLYNSKTSESVTTTGGETITQVSDLGLMEDSAGNLRYYGLDPNNYVTFNGEEAGWRIIGVFNVEDENGNTEQRIKLIRTNAIGSYAYDNKTSGIGSSTTSYGSNDWSDSRLMIMLNPSEETETLRSSDSSLYTLTPGLYWDSGSGYCYSGSSQGTTTCDFSSTGMTDTGKAMIGKAKYSLLGSSTHSGLYADDYYNFEQSTGSVYGTHEKSWTGYVGIMYPSDYAYASDLKVCTYDGYNYNDDTTNCTGTNWIFQGNVVSGSTSKVYTWTISPGSSSANLAFYVYSTGLVNNAYASGVCGVRPVVYLSSQVGIEDGSGTSDDPYILG